MKIAAMMRIRNEERWISEVLAALVPVAERIFVLDDHSIDNTAALCKLNEKVELYHSLFEGLDETRDKNWLLRRVSVHRPEWVICIDGDELLTEDGSDKIRQLANNQSHTAYSFKILYLWNDRNTVRTDGVYGRFYRPSMFRLAANYNATFQSTACGGNLHCSSVPQEFLPSSAKCDVTLHHFGYIDKELRLHKYQYYNRVDPNNYNEDRYRHIIQGDTPLISADRKLLHAGPLRLESI
jgi:glycosyltransferase involved in cell wall biosynthesis